MKRLLAILFFPICAFAQNQGDTLSLGGGVRAPDIGYVNEAGTSIASGDGRANYQAVDKAGRVIVSPPGAALSSWYSSCSSAITGTSRTAVKAAVASNRNYVTSITCKNTSAVASGMDFTDGAGIQFATGSLAAGGSFSVSFPTPFRGSVNTDVSVTMNTTATNTICCANGYISPY